MPSVETKSMVERIADPAVMTRPDFAGAAPGAQVTMSDWGESPTVTPGALALQNRAKRLGLTPALLEAADGALSALRFANNVAPTSLEQRNIPDEEANQPSYKRGGAYRAFTESRLARWALPGAGVLGGSLGLAGPAFAQESAPTPNMDIVAFVQKWHAHMVAQNPGRKDLGPTDVDTQFSLQDAVSSTSSSTNEELVGVRISPRHRSHRYDVQTIIRPPRFRMPVDAYPDPNDINGSIVASLSFPARDIRRETISVTAMRINPRSHKTSAVSKTIQLLGGDTYPTLPLIQFGDNGKGEPADKQHPETTLVSPRGVTSRQITKGELYFMLRFGCEISPVVMAQLQDAKTKRACDNVKDELFREKPRQGKPGVTRYVMNRLGSTTKPGDVTGSSHPLAPISRHVVYRWSR